MFIADISGTDHTLEICNVQKNYYHTKPIK